MVIAGEPIDVDTLRLRHDFLVEPELSVTVDDVVARLHLQARHALLILEALAREEFLRQTGEGRYVRARSASR